MTAIDLDTGELHNVVVRDGRLVVRPGLIAKERLSSSDSGGNTYVFSHTTEYVGAFTVESPTTTEAFHFVFTQDKRSGLVTYAMRTEEWQSIYSGTCGVQPRRPRITYAVVNRQLVINGPAFAHPLYGIVGGGLVPMLKQPSNAGLTAIDPPPGHVCSWRNRVCIAQGATLYVSDGRLDPRTFVAQNAIAFPGTILDLFEGPDGALYVFTTADAYAIPVDALSQSVLALSFIATLPGVNTTRPGTACAAAGRVVALAQNGLTLVSRAGQERIDLQPYEGRRYDTPDVAIADYRDECRLFATRDGVIVAPRERAWWIEVNLRHGYRSYGWTAPGVIFGGIFSGIQAVMATRGGESILVGASSVHYQAGGNCDGETSFLPVRGVVCKRSDVPALRELRARFATIKSDNVGDDVHVHAGSVASSLSCATKQTDAIIGTALWSATEKYTGRDLRSTRLALSGERTADLQCEYGIDGGLREIGAIDLDVETIQSGHRPEKST